MLEYRNLSVQTKTKKILDNISLYLEEGSILGLLGSDEEAKTMMLQVAAGCVKPTKGGVFLNRESLTAEGNQAYINVSYMPRNYGFHEMLSVSEYYELFASLYRVNGRYQERRIEEVLHLVNLEKYKDSFIEEIPLEMYPFLYLGKSILFEPKWLLLDEPYANLGPALQEKMKNILLTLLDQGTSFIINTQLFLNYSSLFTDVAVLENGRITVFGEIDEVMERAMKQSTIRMVVLKNLEDALRVLKNNYLVERVIVDGQKVVFRFHGDEEDEAHLLSDIVYSGALIQNYTRDPVNLEWFSRR